MSQCVGNCCTCVPEWVHCIPVAILECTRTQRNPGQVSAIPTQLDVCAFLNGCAGVSCVLSRLSTPSGAAPADSWSRKTDGVPQ